ncbi:hypothetical protein HPB50_024156 [Hyalomma asiaticum]|uniref:Uncharacterized protein n=1 Tax=Hyalomma asiaticum TaxID=266040 RepID=A0ACB7S392_HYAAI|nr:hypothetical protein HPB50_024156 [Hyalomma asiaticum]
MTAPAPRAIVRSGQVSRKTLFPMRVDCTGSTTLQTYKNNDFEVSKNCGYTYDELRTEGTSVQRFPLGEQEQGKGAAHGGSGDVCPRLPNGTITLLREQSKYSARDVRRHVTKLFPRSRARFADMF